MAIPDYQTVMLPILKFIADGQARSMHELHDHTCELFQLTPEEIQKRLPSGKQTYIGRKR